MRCNKYTRTCVLYNEYFTILRCRNDKHPSCPMLQEEKRESSLRRRWVQMRKSHFNCSLIIVVVTPSNCHTTKCWALWGQPSFLPQCFVAYCSESCRWEEDTSRTLMTLEFKRSYWVMFFVLKSWVLFSSGLVEDFTYFFIIYSDSTERLTLASRENFAPSSWETIFRTFCFTLALSYLRKGIKGYSQSGE